MIIYDSIKNKELEEVRRGFRQLRKEYQAEMDRLVKKYSCGIVPEEERKKLEDKSFSPEKYKAEMERLAKQYRRGIVPEEERKKLEDAFFSQENFEKILPTDSIIRIKGDMINEMMVSENNLYNLNHSILKRLGSDYKTSFLYIGRCNSCGRETGENEIEVDVPVLDYKYVNDPEYFNRFFDTTKCGSCKDLTEAVKTSNLFQIQGKNDYNIRFTSVRKKSKGRLIPKFVEECFGKQKDIRDVYGLMTGCESEEDCNNIPELMLKYSGDSQVECKNCLEVVEKKDKKSGGTVLGNVKYLLYIDKKGRPKRSHIEPFDMQIRSCADSHGHVITAPYRAIHMVVPYKGTIIEVQAKDLREYISENDPASPLFHGNYMKIRGYSGMHHEEYSETEMRKGWGAPERKLERFLRGTDLFDPYTHDLYAKEFPPYQK